MPISQPLLIIQATAMPSERCGVLCPSPRHSVVMGSYVVHKTNNVLRIKFQDGPGDPCAVGVPGRKLAIRLCERRCRGPRPHMIRRQRATDRLPGEAADRPDPKKRFDAGQRRASSRVLRPGAGQFLPVPILGTGLTAVRLLTPVERDVLVCACVELAIGLRPYIASMN
jgi:hypothetical protein